MFDSSSLLTRMAVAKMAGLLIGLAGFVMIPLFMPEAGPLMRWGVLFWYPTMGMVIAMFEMLDCARVLPCRLPWWLRGAIVGAWLNLLVTLIAHDSMRRFLASVFGPDSPFSTPFLFVAEGALAGTLLAYLIMRFGGEGRALEDD